MRSFLNFIIDAYSLCLTLYPSGFRNEFADEMQVVFEDSMNEAAKVGKFSLAMLCMRELVNLPGSILQEFLNENNGRKLKMVAARKNISPDPIHEKYGRWHAFLGALPFILFGMISMTIKIAQTFPDTYSYLVDVYSYLVFYAVMLTGLLFGLIKGGARWTYSYLGWSLIMAWSPWWWESIGYPVFNFHGWQIWISLIAIFLTAVLIKRSLSPVIQFVKNIWQDWTLLSLAIYAVVAFFFLIYDENHTPYLIAFMVASTLAITVSVWVFMRSANPLHRFIVLMSGFVANLVIDRVSWSTWDYAAYYGLPLSPATPWYDSILEVILFTGFWGFILLLPAILGLVRHATNEHAV